jgi:hypothetical protein
VVKVATPLANATILRVVLPSLNVTLPAGVPLNSAATVAVKVTDCPKVEGFCEEVRVTALVALVHNRMTWRSLMNTLPS